GNSVDVSAIAVLTPRLAVLLDKYSDACEVQAGVVYILRTVCSHERGGEACSEALASNEALPPLLALYSRQRVINRELYILLARVCPYDKMFAVKARFSGVFAMPLNDLTALVNGQAGPAVAASREATTQPILQVLRAVLANKNSVMQLLDQGVLEALLPVLERGGLLTTEKVRCILAVLQIVLHVVSFKMGRKAVARKALCQQLMAMADLVTGQQGLLSGISEILYRCLPPLKLPIERTSRTYTQLLRENFNKRLPSPPNKDSSESSLLELFDRITSFDENMEDLPFLGNIDRKQVLHKLAKDVVRPPPEGMDQGGWVAEAEFWMLNPHNLQLNLEPLNVSPALESVALLNHMKAHYSSELTNKRYPVVYDVTQGPLFEDLSFESRFEGGNLRRVVQRSSREYDLILNPDVNTSRHHFWFYFGVKNLTARVVYTFNIINLDRRDTMYTKRGSAGGLSPILFSDGTWTRLSSLPGFSLSCYKNHYRYFTRIPHRIRNIRCVRKMCNSVLGNKCYLLTITDKASGLSNAMQKPVIFLSSRVHPGETNSSHIMYGALQALLSDHPAAISLREKFVFYVVPMINPDGVVCGNQRCGMAGVDLNRQYENPCPVQHPTVFHTKAVLAYLTASGRSPFVVIDIHGHSRAHNVFMFGCEDSPAQRLLPNILHSQLKSFNQGQCTYKTEASKRGALRISAWKELKLSLSYTMECTIAGCDFRSYKGFHLGIEQLEEIGRELIWALDKIGTDRATLEMIAAKTDFNCHNHSRTTSPSEKVHLSDSSSSDDEPNVIEDDD
ncbi:cytosolic carboxypeptidase 1-like, partial [Tropilaelaps mercedesae]